MNGSAINEAKNDPNEKMESMLNLMSITKGVIGFLYATTPTINGEDRLIGTITVDQALNHQTGLSDDGTFDYLHYRALAETSASAVLAYCHTMLQTAPPGFAYNNIIWHLLSHHYRVRTGMTCGEALQRRLVNRDWLWEQTTDGTALGPHGLYMSKPAFSELMSIVSPWLEHIHLTKWATMTRVPAEHWEFLGPQTCTARRIWHGWWFQEAQVAWGHGYYAQFVFINFRNGQIRAQLQRGDAAYDEVPRRQLFIERCLELPV